MTEYISKTNIPILDEHTTRIRGDDGKIETITVDASDLHKIASNGNRRVRETGDYVPVVIGHTKEGAKETDQPPIVGWAKNFVVKKFGKTGRKAIYATFLFMKDKYNLAKNFPRRSVELWPGRHEIDPISLLGATTPERDLGLIKFSRGKVVRYARTIGEADMPVPPGKPPVKPDGGGSPADAGESEVDKIANKVFQLFEESDVYQWAKAQMEQSGGEGQDQPPPDEGMEGNPDLEMAGEGGPDEGADPNGDEPPPMPPEDEHAPIKKGAGYGSPSNDFVPGAGKTKEQYARDRGELMQLQRSHEAQARENIDLRLRMRRLEREKDLLKLQSPEGGAIDFDIDEELDYVGGLDDITYQKHLDKIRKRYQRSPVTSTPWLRQQDTAPISMARTRTKDEVDRVVAYARAKNLSYDDALKQVDGERVL